VPLLNRERSVRCTCSGIPPRNTAVSTCFGTYPFLTSAPSIDNRCNCALARMVYVLSESSVKRSYKQLCGGGPFRSVIAFITRVHRSRGRILRREYRVKE
jgi:hypothetical protein